MTNSRSFWPYQVRRLLDSGWTHEELARALKATPERIRQYVNGKAIPEPITQRDLLRMLTTYEKRAEVEARPAPPIADRGVTEDDHPPAGQRVFKVISSEPGKVGIVIWPEDWVTPQFIRSLEIGLEMRDPQKLKVI